MGKIIAIILSLGFLISCASSNKDKEKADLHFRIGTAHLNNGNYPLALRELLEAHKLDPENAQVCNNLALAYFVRGKMTEAEKYFLKALEADPKYTDALNNLGRTHIELGKFDLAMAELTRVVNDLTYQHPEKGFANLGLANINTKNYTAAVKHLRKALQTNNKFCPAHGLYAQALYFLNDFKKAAQAADTAVQLCRDLDEAHYYGALSYAKLGRKEIALARMKELIVQYPNSAYGNDARSYIATAEKNGIEE